MAAGALVPIVIVGLGAKLVAPHIANMLIKNGMATAGKALARTSKNVVETMEALPNWVMKQLQGRNVAAAKREGPSTKQIHAERRAARQKRAAENKKKKEEQRKRGAEQRKAAQEKKKAEAKREVEPKEDKLTFEEKGKIISRKNLEDAGITGGKYDKTNPEHRRLYGQWANKKKAAEKLLEDRTFQANLKSKRKIAAAKKVTKAPVTPRSQQKMYLPGKKETTKIKKGGKVFNKGGKVFNGNDFVRSFYEGGSV